MPLEKGSSRAAVGHNIKTEESAGKPRAQAIAIALKTAGLSNQDAIADGIGFCRKSSAAARSAVAMPMSSGRCENHSEAGPSRSLATANPSYDPLMRG